MKRKLALGVAIVALAAGCALPASKSQKALPANPDAPVGGTLRIGITNPGAIEPTFVASPAGEMVTSLICEGLVLRDPITGEYRPGLVDFFENVDGNYSMKFRKSMKFNDGSKITNKDMTYSFIRLMDPDESSYYSGLMRFIAGYKAWREEETKPTDTTIGKIEVKTALELNIEGDQKTPDAPQVLALPQTAIIKKADVESNPAVFAGQPTCSGPYKLEKRYRPGDATINLIRNDNYHGSSSTFTNGGAGYAEKVVFHVYEDPAAVYDAYRKGQVDVIRLEGDQVAQARTEFAPDLVVGPSPSVEYIGIPFFGLEPFDKPEVRRALSQALDRTKISQAVFGGARSPATGFLPPSAGSVYRKAACGSAAPAEANVARAQATLRGAGVNLSGRTVPFYYNDEGMHKAMVEEVAREWQAAFGLVLDLQPMKWEDYEDKSRSATGFDGFFRESWGQIDTLPLDYLQPLFTLEAAGGANLARYSNRAIDFAFLRYQRRASDTNAEDNHAELRRVEDAVCQLVPIIPVVFGSNAFLVRDSKILSARDASKVSEINSRAKDWLDDNPEGKDLVDYVKSLYKNDLQYVTFDGRLLLRELYVKPGVVDTEADKGDKADAGGDKGDKGDAGASTTTTTAAAGGGDAGAGAGGGAGAGAGGGAGEGGGAGAGAGAGGGASSGGGASDAGGGQGGGPAGPGGGSGGDLGNGGLDG